VLLLLSIHCFISPLYCYVKFLVLKTTKTQKDFICFFWLFTSGHLSYASKNQKEQKYFRFLETNAKTEVLKLLKSAHCFIFHLFSVTPIELKF